MADSDKTELIARFTSVTGADTDRAKFFLESSAWRLDLALASFYEGDNDNFGEGQVPMEAASESSQQHGQEPSSDWPPQPRTQPRIATFSSMQSSSKDDSDEEGQAFYTGGSERGGGQQILGPKKKNADEFIQNMFKSAKDHGAEEVSAGSSAPQRSTASAFGGAGYRLGETEADSQKIAGSHAATHAPRQVDVILKLWKTGFSVDDGELRGYNEPQNKEFLDSIHRGEVPNELLRMAKGGEVNLNMEDHRGEDYVAPKKKMKAFTGEGHMLGSPAPSVTQVPSGQAGQAEATGEAKVDIDSSQPTTNLQIRLSDGSRLIAKFNHSHKISDVRNYLNSSRPQFAASNYVLMTTFPNKELDDENQSLSDAKLLNAVLVQRMK